MTEISPGVITWWLTISIISVGNLVVLGTVARGLERRRVTIAPAEYADRRVQLMLAIVFVVGCAFRSFLPRAEAQRITFVDSWISSAMIARWVATAAELSLVTQFSLVLRQYARAAGHRPAVAASWLLVPFIAWAELCSWYTTLTTNFIGSVIEESTWAVTGTVVVSAFAALWPRLSAAQRRFAAVAILLNASYVVFMVSVDVPMYWSRWEAGQGGGAHYLTVAQGWFDSQRRRVVTLRWEDWRQEMPWMSLYFSVGAWISLGLVRAPRSEPEPVTEPSPTPGGPPR
jgi:hypothetical protein